VGPSSDVYVVAGLLRKSQRAPSARPSAGARVPTGCPCTPTRQSEISDSPACVAADTKASIPSASMRPHPGQIERQYCRRSVQFIGHDPGASSRLLRGASSPLTYMTLVLVGDRFTSTVEGAGLCLPSLQLDCSIHPPGAHSLWRQRNPLTAMGINHQGPIVHGVNGGKGGARRHTGPGRIEKTPFEGRHAGTACLARQGSAAPLLLPKVRSLVRV